MRTHSDFCIHTSRILWQAKFVNCIRSSLLANNCTSLSKLAGAQGTFCGTHYTTFHSTLKILRVLRVIMLSFKNSSAKALEPRRITGIPTHTDSIPQNWFANTSHLAWPRECCTRYGWSCFLGNISHIHNHELSTSHKH